MAHSQSSGVNGIIDFVAGSLGGCANVIVGQPLDTCKVSFDLNDLLLLEEFKF